MEEGVKKSHGSAHRVPKKAKKDKCQVGHLEGRHERWAALRSIQAKDSIGDIRTVKEYMRTMFTPRDLSNIHEQRLKAERL